MTNLRVQTILRRALGLACVLSLTGVLLVAQQPPPPAQAPAPQGPAQLLSPQQLDNLVAPIALYPDPLLGQILAASTYPLEIVEAAQWLSQNSNLQGAQLMDAARQQNWDPSVQALVAFPDVVNRLNGDIRWTTDLGNAFLAQQSDVMQAVQRMRLRAMQNGKLSSNAQQTVTTDDQGGQPEVEIQPASPDVVYVPYYNPAYVWGPPLWGYYPDWDYPAFGFGFGFGPGIYLGGFFGGLGWGNWGWGLNWYGGALFERPFFFNHCGFWGFHGGRAYGRGGVLWAHDPGHRMGVAYPTRGLTSRYGSASMAGRAFAGGRYAGSSYAAGRSYAGAGRSYANGAGYANRGNVVPSRGNSVASGGWHNFSQGRTAGNTAGRGYSTAPRSSYSPSYGRSYGSSPSYGRSYNYGSSRGYNYGSSPSYGRSYARSYGSTGSYGAYRGYSGGGRSYSAPSSRSYGGGGAYRSGGGGFRSSGGGSFHGGGGGGFHGGGGGGFHGGGGGRR